MNDLQAAFAAASDTILVVDQVGKILYLNRAIPPRTVEQVLGRTCFEMLHPDSHPQVREGLVALFAGATLVEVDTRVDSIEGKPVYYSGRMAPVRRDGQVVSVIILAADVTTRKLQELELSQSREELRSFSASLQAAQEAERLRIARELHDGLGQLLTALGTQLSWLEERLKGPLQERAGSMSELVRHSLQTVRELASGLRPSLLDDLGLGAAIDWLAKEMCQRADIACDVRFQLDEKALDHGCKLCLFRICQEALTNVVRHSQARGVRIVVEQVGQEICLCVEDDGRGFGVEQRKRPSVGLLGMRERALQRAGTTEIRARDGGGTLVCVRLPLDLNGQLP